MIFGHLKPTANSTTLTDVIRYPVRLKRLPCIADVACGIEVVRASAFRSNAFSIGLKSSEYGGRQSTAEPAASIIALTRWVFVAGEGVHDDGRTGLGFRHQDRLDNYLEITAVDWTIEDERGDHSA